MMKNCDTKNSGGFTRPMPPKEPPPSLTLSTVGREPGGAIVCRPQVVRGPFQIVTGAHELPPEWLERAIPINLDDAEDESCL